VELPFTVVFEPPSQEELRALLRMRRTWVAVLLTALAIGTSLFLSSVGRADAVAGGTPLPLELTSRPAGAGVWLDGRERGRTPLELSLEPGPHSVLLRANDMLEATYAVPSAAEPRALEAVLLRRIPKVVRVRSTLPGAVLSDVRPLADGGLALSLALAAGRLQQAWRLDPVSGEVQPLLTEVASRRVAVAPDGRQVAYLGQEIGPLESSAESAAVAGHSASVVWLVLAGQSAPGRGWRAPLLAGEGLVDLSWSPQTDRLLVIGAQVLPGGAQRSRLWFVDADGQHAQEALSLPSDVVPGSELWSPDGQHVAFVAHAAQVNALCLLDLDGTFRYVADLDPSAAQRLAYPPATWSADSQRLLFVAPRQHPPDQPLAWLQSQVQHALFVASAAQPLPALIGDTDVQLAAWREDGQMLGLGRPNADGALVISLLGNSGTGQRLVNLPLKPGAGFAATWDAARARVLVASPAPSGGTDYWLAMLGAEGQS
jgi:hypothetical protein